VPQQIKCKIEAIIPRKFETDQITQAIQAEIMKLAKDMKRDLEATTETWDASDKPTFSSPRINRRGRDLSIEITTNSALWAMLNNGIPAHTITPKQAKALKFQPWYMPKTTPMRLKSRAGGQRGGNPRFAKAVQHPGVQPRNWILALQVKYTAPMQLRMMQALKQGLGKGVPGYIDRKKYSSPSAVRVQGAP
jgi:hypothetical protein